MIVFPPAKINLGLNVTEKRPDGYHNLETIFYPIPLEDMLEVVVDTDLRTDYVLKQTGLAVQGEAEDNLIIKALRLLKKEFDIPPVRIYLHKLIPSGAGLGGGSSDAAYMLRVLKELFDLPLSTSQLEAYASQLGADCAFFIQAQPTFATGIGNVFTPIALSLAGYQLFLTKPELFISTSMAYGNIIPAQPQLSLQEICKLPVSDWKTKMVNDFEEPIFQVYPDLQAIKDSLYEAGAEYAAMSGSGSSIFGLFKGKCPLVPRADKNEYILDLK